MVSPGLGLVKVQCVCVYVLSLVCFVLAKGWLLRPLVFEIILRMIVLHSLLNVNWVKVIFGLMTWLAISLFCIYPSQFYFMFQGQILILVILFLIGRRWDNCKNVNLWTGHMERIITARFGWICRLFDESELLAFWWLIDQ